MAISTKNVNINTKKHKQLHDNNFDCPCPCPPVKPEELQLYNSFEEAEIAVNKIRLKPGDSHVEFYKEDNKIHCVVGIGNINQGKAHLIITDNGDLGPISS